MSETHVTIMCLQKALIEEIEGRRAAEKQRDFYLELCSEYAEQRDAALKGMCQ